MPALTKESRKHRRVETRNCFARLIHPVIPPLNCKMLDLSEGGMRCSMVMSELDNFNSTAWRQLLGSGKPITVEVPGVGGQKCQAQGDVRHVRLGNGGEIMFGLKFRALDNMQQGVVSRAVNALAKSGNALEFVPPPTQSNEPARPTSTVILGKAFSSRTDLKKPVSSKMQAQPATPAPAPAPAAPRYKPSSFIGQAKALWSDLMSPTPKPGINYKGMKIGEILMRLGRISPQQAVTAFEQSKAKGLKFGHYLLEQKLITTQELCRAMSLQTGLPMVDLTTLTLPDTVRSVIPFEILQQYQFVPFNQFGKELFIAVAMPLSKSVMTELQHACGLGLKVFLAREDVLLAMLNSGYFNSESEA